MKSLPVINNQTLKISEAELISGTLSKPSKMPGYGYGIPAQECLVGAKLRLVPNSVCHKCYAFGGNYQWPGVKNAQYKRFANLDNPAWVEAMIVLINAKTNPDDAYFRWHDSGDLQSEEHLQQIVDVCLGTPDIKHWLPTREYGIVRNYLKNGGKIPSNLAIRLSAHMIDGPVPDKDNLPFSSVSTNDSIYSDAYNCPSRHQDNKCGDCRACWDTKVNHISYHKH